MPTSIGTSTNITSLDSKIVADLCSGFFYIDVTPSVFLPGGTSTSGGVQGANVKITNPLGIVIKQFSTSGFDIYPPMTSRVSFAIPTLAGNYQYGTYTVEVQLTDNDGTQYTITKTITICPPDPNNKNKKVGCLNVSINGNCKDGKVVILLDQPPNYNGKMFSSQVVTGTLQYPTSSGLPNISFTHPAFSVKLYEGEYIITGSTCVWYEYGDNVFFNIKYKINCSKVIKCIIDMCCVQAKFDQLNARRKSDCNAEERETTASIILDAMFLVNAAQGAANCGQDPSDYIAELEELLGCVCTCNCNEGVPIVNNTPAKDFLIEGCNVNKSSDGLTDIYNIDVYDYSLVNDDETGVLTLGAVITDGCTKRQHINIDLDKITTDGQDWIYRGLLSQLSISNPTAVADSKNKVTIIWTRVSQGVYRGTLSGTFTPLTANNTFCIASATITNCKMAATYESANTILVTSTAIDAGIAQDGLLDNTPIELSILNA